MEERRVTEAISRMKPAKRRTTDRSDKRSCFGSSGKISICLNHSEEPKPTAVWAEPTLASKGHVDSRPRMTTKQGGSTSQAASPSSGRPVKYSLFALQLGRTATTPSHGVAQESIAAVEMATVSVHYPSRRLQRGVRSLTSKARIQSRPV